MAAYLALELLGCGLSAAQLSEERYPSKAWIMTYDDMLYLDLDFLTEKYEENTGVAPSTVISMAC